MNVDRIYLDHAATTSVRDEVLATMLPLLRDGYNPSSLHAEGRAARTALDRARDDVAHVLGAKPREIVFTGGGSEADTLAIVGVARARAAAGKHVVTTAIEHHAVLHAVDVLEAEGWAVTRLPVSAGGVVDPADFAAALRPDTTFASVMLANNEIGTIQPIAELAALARARGVVFHTDAVQAPGQLALDVATLGVDLLALSAHKFSGPKGVGVLWVRSGTPIAPLIVGGDQEHGLRAGTENVAGIAGLAQALRLADAERRDTAPRMARLRDRLAAAIVALDPSARINAENAPRLANNLSVAFADVPSDGLLIALDLEGVSASAGSACAAGSLEPSHVVAALGVPQRYANGVIRFSLGRATTERDVDRTAEILARVLAPWRRTALSFSV